MEWGKEEAAFHSFDLEVPSGLPGGDVPRMLVSGQTKQGVHEPQNETNWVGKEKHRFCPSKTQEAERGRAEGAT